MKVFWLKRATLQYLATTDYLEENVSLSSSDNLTDRITEKIETLKKYPTMGRPSQKRENVRFVLIPQHYRLYYRVKKDRLEILSFFDTRQNPKKDKFG